MRLDITKIREDFPILQTKVHGKPLIYLDNAATTQKPKVVIEALQKYYLEQNANIHRGAHYLAAKATETYEATRQRIRQHLNAQYDEEIIFTRGTTEAINLLANTLTDQITSEDEIIISTLEHHSNIVPWQMLCQRTGATLKVIPIDDRGVLDIEAYQSLLSPKTQLVAVNHISNALGTINPIREIIQLAHQVGAKVLIDGAQGLVHCPVDVQDLDCDFYAFSGHKIYGPTGVGALYGKKKWLEALPPYHGGGEMIKEVTLQKSTYADLPYKFEAGTPNIADVIALDKAIEYVEMIGKDNIASHEQQLLDYATSQLADFDKLQIIGTAPDKASVISFVFEDLHHSDVGALLDQQGVAIRTGHHCAQPLMKRLLISGTSRASFAVYNDTKDVDHFVEALHKVVKMLR